MAANINGQRGECKAALRRQASGVSKNENVVCAISKARFVKRIYKTNSSLLKRLEMTSP